MKNVKHILLVLSCFYANFIFSQCGPLTPAFTVNLIGQPNGTYTSPPIQRNDNCCGTTAPDVCIKFTIFLDPQAIGINFQIVAGAVPPGALFYQINCGPPVAVGSPICLNGPGPHILTFCKPGNNQNQFAIISLPGPSVPDSVMVRSGCSVSLAVTGFSVPTINWTSVFPGPNGTYNSYLSCVSGCASVIVTPTGTPPAFVDYQVSGFGASPCIGNFYQDTVRVYFYNDLLAIINPTLTTLCFGQNNAILTGSASGGLAPYTYSWSTGSTNQSITVGPGTYTLLVNDNTTGCPPATTTAVVNSFSLPISANAGPDQTLCKSSPNAVLNGTVVMASGGMWGGGTGTYSPSQNSLNITYIPTLAELATGSVQLTFTTTGNAGCPPGSDVVILNYQNPAIANAGPNATVCANNNVVNLSGSITGFTSTPLWSTAGTGVFSSTTILAPTYTPSPADISAGFVNITLTTANNGVCPPASSTMQIIITPAPVVNAGANQTICSTGQAVLSGTVTGPTNTGFWTSNGSGTFSPSPNILNPNYIPSPADITAGSVTLVLTSTGNGNCIAVTNSMVITIIQIATVTVIPSQSICATASTIGLSGNISGGTNTGLWATSGSGAFNPGPTVLTNTYFIVPGDVGAGMIIFSLTSTNNGPCAAVTNTLSLTFFTLAIVNAGPDQLVCSSPGTIGLNATSTNMGAWTTNGSGSFIPNNTFLNATYSMTPADILSGSVTFTFSSANNGACPVVQDVVIISIQTIATVNSSSSQSICSTTSSVNISGTVTGGTSTGNWSTTGAGTFNPGPAFLNNAYLINPSDITAGLVTFSLTSTNNGPCPAVTSTLSLNIFLLATVNSGLNQALCSNTPTLGLSGTININAGFWSSNGTGTFVPNNAVLNPIYSISPADIIAGSVTFTLISANNAPCPTVQDTVKISIKTLAVVNSGSSQVICSSTGTVNLNGNVSGGTSTGIWSTNGNGAFNPGATVLNNLYFVSISDISLGTIIFTLTSLNNSPCPAVTDTMMLTIYQLPIVNSGPNQALCANAGTVGLSGSIVSLSNSGVWASNGTGTFSPDDTNLNPVYSITQNDINTGAVTFTLFSTNNGPCPIVRDTVKISIKKLAKVNAGPNKSICSTSPIFNLSGTISEGSSSGIWSHNGGGNVAPNSTVMNISYTITQFDINAGVINFILTSLNNGVCPEVKDTARILIFENPVIRLSGDTTICSYQNPVKITPNISGDYGLLQWSSNGSGNFIPNNFTNPITYDITGDISVGQVILSIATLSNGPCANVNASIRVTIRKAPVADFTASTYTANIPNDPISFTNLSTNANTYYWNFGDGSFSSLANPIHNFIEVGYYNVNLVAMTSYGCSDTITRQILVISDIQFPTVFTPNIGGPNGGSYNVNDYSNDVFFPYTSGVIEYDLKIFNRWGELIFESFELKVGWDGYFKGKLCQQDGYVWKADVKFFDGRTYNKTGSITLLR